MSARRSLLPLLIFKTGFFFLILLPMGAFAVKVRGIIKDTKGEPLSFASVVVKGQTIGTMANGDGEFMLDLEGNKDYDLVVQFLGYKTETRAVQLKNADIFLDIILEEQSILLKEVSVGRSKEDPAYAIMRKAIAKSKIHDKQVDYFDADLYVKNTLTVNKVPGIVKKEFQKSGIKIGIPDVSEEMINLKFTQPNKRVTKVLARKNSMDQMAISGGYYLLNLYNIPESIDLVSPLSPKAFSYYRFEYLGYFEDQGQIVNKIKIIPKSYGPGVCRGTIYIVDGLWCIHSVDAESVNQGFNIKLKQLYAPVKNVWVPVSQIIDFGGRPFGFDFKAKLQVNPKYKTLTVNNKYISEVKIVEASEVPKRKVQDISLTQKELSLKELNKLARQMEKQDKAAVKKEERNVVSESSISFDSLYQKRDLGYWEEMRSIPLSEEEKRSYVIGDSIRIVKAEKDTTENSSAKKIKNPFLRKAFIESTWVISKKPEYDVKLKYTSPFLPFFGLNYNIVEGVFTQSRIEFTKAPKNKSYEGWSYSWNNKLRYAFGMNRFMAASEAKFTKGNNAVLFGGGSFTQTFDQNQNIPLFANTIVNLFKVNLTQLYMKEGGYLGYNYTRENVFQVSTRLEYAHRSMLYNLPDIKLGFGNREPTPNSPANVELGSSDFPTHQAFVWSNSVFYRPGARFKISNGRKVYAGSNWPEFRLNYTKGLGDVDYDFLSLGVKQDLKSGPNEKLKYYAEVGDFVNSSRLYLMDMKHVNSVNFTDAAGGTFAFYRLLNTDLPLQISPDGYYRYSTQGGYIKLHAMNEFRKLLVTQVPIARFTGLKEDIFVNYLKTPAKKNYLEVGYGIDGIFKLLRFEVITAFEKGVRQRWGWQIGVTL